FDHDTATIFHSSNAVTPDQMMEIDMGAAYQMDKFTYQPRMDNKGNGAVQQMDVYASLDGKNYTKVWDGAKNPEWKYNTSDMDIADIKEINLNGLKVRYLKLSVLKSTGGFFSASELTPYKKDGTDAWVVGDVNNSGALDDNDLVFYENYMGLKPVDDDWDYATLGNMDNNDIIDAYDISFVASMLGEKITSAKKGVEGKIQIIPSKTDIKAGDYVTLDVYGIGLKNVNAFSIEIPQDKTLFDITSAGAPSLESIFMKNFSKTRLHSDGTRDDYICFTNVGKQDLLSGSGSLAQVSIKANRDFTWDTNATRALLVGQDLSTTDAMIDDSFVPTPPETEYILKQSDIKSIDFDNDVKQNIDGSELWQQGNWKDILFDGDTSGGLAEFKWYHPGVDIAAEVKLPTDMTFTFDQKQPLTKVRVYNRASSNGRVSSIKAEGYDGDKAYPLGRFTSDQDVYEFDIPKMASGIDKVVITPMSSVGKTMGTQTGSETNRMLSLHEIQFVADSPVPAESISFDDTSAKSLYIGEMAEVSATVAPNEASNPFYNITSSDSNIASVMKIPMEDHYVFVIKGESAGSVTLSATSQDGNFTDTWEVEVIDGVDTTTLDAEIAKGEGLNEVLYTTTSWKPYKEALEAAKILSANPTSQDAVNKVTIDLIMKRNALKFKGSNEDQPSSENLIDQSKMSLFYETSFFTSPEMHGDRVLDNNAETFWYSSPTNDKPLPEYLVIDLGAEYDLEQVNMLPRAGAPTGQISHYRIEVSTTKATKRDTLSIDDLEFTPVVEGYFENDGSSLTNDEVEQEVKFDTVKARYVKFMAMETLGAIPNKYVIISELNFYGLKLATYDDLQKKIVEVDNMILDGKEDKYTTSSWGPLMDAHALAKAVKADATVQEIRNAMTRIETALTQLEKRASDYVLVSLNKLLDTCKAMEDDYPKSEFEEMKEVITSTEELLAKGAADISSKAASKAMQDLLAAKKDLETVTDAEVARKNLQAHIDSANEMLADDVSGIRPAKVQALKDAVATGQALIDAESEDIDAMQKAMDAISAASQELWEIVDKAELNDLIAAADAYQEGDYAADAWKAFTDALANAKVVLKNDDATIPEVEEAYQKLADAIAALEMKAELNTEALEKEIAIVENMVANISKYIPSSVSGLATALEDAKKVLAMTNDTAKARALTKTLTQQDIDKATEKLVEAKLRAILKPDTSALAKLVKEAESLSVDGYEQSSVSAFHNALENAKRALENEETTAKDVEIAIQGLKTAMENLSLASTETNPDGNAGIKTNDTSDVNALYMMLMIAGVILLKSKRKKTIS
ncbi:MAG: discoidin domain-containing protein, partial [Breznakia sp.]